MVIFNWLLRHPARWSAFSLLILLGSGTWVWFARLPAEAAAERVPSPRAGFPAPGFTLENLSGQAQALSAFQGQVVILNLWASWCGPCRAEMPELQKVYQANRQRGLVVLAVNSTVQDDETAARAFAQELGLTFPVLLDRDGVVSRRYLLRALPSTFFIDRRGVIRQVIIGGPMSRAVLQTQVETLLQEAP